MFIWCGHVTYFQTVFSSSAVAFVSLTDLTDGLTSFGSASLFSTGTGIEGAVKFEVEDVEDAGAIEVGVLAFVNCASPVKCDDVTNWDRGLFDPAIAFSFFLFASIFSN